MRTCYTTLYNYLLPLSVTGWAIVKIKNERKEEKRKSPECCTVPGEGVRVSSQLSSKRRGKPVPGSTPRKLATVRELESNDPSWKFEKGRCKH